MSSIVEDGHDGDGHLSYYEPDVDLLSASRSTMF